MPQTPKSQIKKSGENLNKATEYLGKAGLEIAKTTRDISRGIYQVIDTGDLRLAKTLDQNFGKTTNKVLRFTRKNILKILLATSVLVSGGATFIDSKKDPNKNISDSTEVLSSVSLEKIDYKIPTPEGLKGRNMSNLYSHYLGYGGKSATIGDTIKFRPNSILDTLYKRKFNRENKKGLTVAQSFYEENVKNNNFDIVVPLDLEKMRSNIQKEINEVNQNFDRVKFGEEKLKNNKKKLDLFKKICHKIDDKCLLSYGMTELMPSADGKLNQEVLDFLLKNGGEEFLMSLPAIADDYTSFGLYQFTSFAIFDTGKEKRGASVTNSFLPKEHKIPGSVVKLQGSDHHKAAYLFAMYNLYTLVFSANEQELKALHFLLNQKDNNNLTQLIAIMHNYPANGGKFLMERYKLNTDKKYLSQKTHHKDRKKLGPYDLNGNGKIDLYETYTGDQKKGFDSKKVSHDYGKKTFFNYKHLP